LTGREFWMEADGSLPMLLREICVDPIPFASARVAEIAAVTNAATPIPPLPPGFDAWFARCVVRDVDARFPGAGEAVRAFGELVTNDAPRGALVAAGGTGDLSAMGAAARSVPLGSGTVPLRATGLAASATAPGATGSSSSGTLAK